MPGCDGKPRVQETGRLVSIVMVNWNTRDPLLGCIESVLANRGDVDLEITVVDNASTDGSAEALRERYPDVKLIASDTNLGFAAGNNVALREVTGAYVLFLNPDTIVGPGMVRRLVDFLDERTEVGMVGPRVEGIDGKLQISSFGLLPSPSEAAAHALRIWRIAPHSRLAARFHVVPSEDETWTYTGHLLGACILARREVIDQLDGFDEGFFLFLEETDLCYRAAEMGWRIAYVTDTHVVHLGQQSMRQILGKAGGLYIKSYNRFCAKHKVKPMARLLANVFLLLGIGVDAATVLVKQRSPRRALRFLSAIWEGYMG